MVRCSSPMGHTRDQEHMGGFWILELPIWTRPLVWARKGAIACDAAGEVRSFFSSRTPNGATE